MSAKDTFQGLPKARLPGLYENPYEAPETNLAKSAESPARSEKSRKGIKAASAVLLAVGAVVTADSKTTARFINDVINRDQNAMTMPSIPKPEDATAIIIGDTIEFKTADGKTHKVKVQTLSDITAAAQSIDPEINYSSYDSMLESENNNSAEVHFGDRFTVDKSLGITDLGPSAD